MTDFFDQLEFVTKYNMLKNKAYILDEMCELKTKYPDTQIATFVCILDKIIDPHTSDVGISAFQYIAAVKLWNSFQISKNTILIKLVI
jgi:hypothetical protein